jgi:hypothetical protein
MVLPILVFELIYARDETGHSQHGRHQTIS